MKFKLILLLLSAICLTATAQQDVTHLVIQTKDGVKVAYALEEIPKVTFAEDELILFTNDVNISYPIDDLATITYENHIVNGMKDLKTDEISYQLIGRSLLFHSLKSGNSISIFSLNGDTVLTRVIGQDGEYYLSLSSLASGVYIVKVNNSSCKVIIK